MTRRALGAIQMFKNRALGRAWNSWWGIALEKRQEAIRLELEELRKQSAIDSLELDVLKNKPAISEETLLELENLRRHSLLLEQELGAAAGAYRL